MIEVSRVPGAGDEVVLRNDHLRVLVSPRRGGRLLLVGVEHGGPLVDAGHEDDRWEVVAARPYAGGVEAVLGHVRGGCPLIGSMKVCRLAAGAREVEVDYRLAPVDAPFAVCWAPTGATFTSTDRRFVVQFGMDGPLGPGWAIDLRSPGVDVADEPDAAATEEAATTVRSDP